MKNLLILIALALVLSGCTCNYSARKYVLNLDQLEISEEARIAIELQFEILAEVLETVTQTPHNDIKPDISIPMLP